MWLDTYYSLIVLFRVDSVPFPTIDLRYIVTNNQAKSFLGDTFTFVFYQVEIDQIWDNPTEDSDYQEFSFPIQTEFWDGTSTGTSKRAYTFTNYLDTNEDGTVFIKTEF